MVIYVVKTTFAPFLAIGGNPANAGVTRLCGISPCPVPDTATALPNVAPYQLGYTRLFRYLSGWSCSTKASALYPEAHSAKAVALHSVIEFFIRLVVFHQSSCAAPGQVLFYYTITREKCKWEWRGKCGRLETSE